MFDWERESLLDGRLPNCMCSCSVQRPRCGIRDRMRKSRCCEMGKESRDEISGISDEWLSRYSSTRCLRRRRPSRQRYMDRASAGARRDLGLLAHGSQPNPFRHKRHCSKQSTSHCLMLEMVVVGNKEVNDQSLQVSRASASESSSKLPMPRRLGQSLFPNSASRKSVTMSA